MGHTCHTIHTSRRCGDFASTERVFDIPAKLKSEGWCRSWLFNVPLHGAITPFPC